MVLGAMSGREESAFLAQAQFLLNVSGQMLVRSVDAESTNPEGRLLACSWSRLLNVILFHDVPANGATLLRLKPGKTTDQSGQCGFVNVRVL